MNPELTQDQRNRLEALAEEYAGRKRLGDEVKLDEYIGRYPEMASDIRALFPIVAMLDQVAPAMDQESSERIEPGSRLGEYQLLRVIGRGGMGVVYQAEHIALGSIAAIKVLPAAHSGPKGRERFQREASAAARMHHPNIVRVFDFGCHGDSLYYVMPLVEGWGLDRLIGNQEAIAKEREGQVANNDSMPPTKADLAATLALSGILESELAVDQDRIESEKETGRVAASPTRDSSASGSRPHDLWNWVALLGIQTADALAYAHSTGIVHRDIKPSNLMVDADNHVYVTDFGLAKVVDEYGLTGTGDLLGTLRYMPPESFAGKADHRSDIYSLGLTLYELLANQPAFTDVDRGNLISAISNGQITQLRQIIPKIPRDLETVLQKSFATEPVDRYQAAGEFRDDLSRFVRGEPVQARRTSLPYKAAKWIRRNRVVSGLVASVFVMAAIAAVAFSISENRKRFANLQQQLASEKQELADERKQSADRIANIFDRFLRGYDPSFKMRETITREDLLDDAAALLDTEFEKDPLVEAKLRMTVGTAYLWDDQTDTVLKGEPHLKRAVELLKKHDGEPVELARALTGLARTRCFGGLPSEANPLGLVSEIEANKQLLEQALEIHQRNNQPGLYWAETLEVLALVELNFGGSDESKQLVKQGIAMLEGDQSYEAIRTRALLFGIQARAQVQAEDMKLAELSFTKATELSEQLGNFLVPFHAYDLGNIQLYNGKFVEGESTFKKYLDSDPHIFWPKVAMAMAAQGDWQRVLEWSKKSTSGFDHSSLKGLQSRRIEAMYLRLSGDDEQAMQILQDVVQKMRPTFDPASPQQMREFMEANNSLLRMMLFSENPRLRAMGINIVQSIRDNLPPTSPSSSGAIRRGYAIAISLLPNISDADMALAERCIELEELDRPKEQKWTQYDCEFLLAKALVNQAKGNRSAAISSLRQILELSNGRDHFVYRTIYRAPYVWPPTLRIAEETLVRWLCEDGKQDDAVALMQQAVKNRMAIEYPSQHLINFANARLARLLIKVDRNEEARKLLNELAATTKDGPECFKWLEKRVAADLKLTE